MALRYIVGFAINKSMRKKQCPTIIDLTKQGEFDLKSELFLKYKKDFSFKEINFCNSDDYFFKVLSYNFQIYNICFKHLLYIRNVKGVLIEFCIRYSNEKFQNYFNDGMCSRCNFNHRKDILEYVFRILLRRNCSWIKIGIKGSTKKYNHLKKYSN